MATKKKSQQGAKARARGSNSTRARSSSRAQSRRAPAKKSGSKAQRVATPKGPMIFGTLIVLLAIGAWSLYPAARMQYQEERNKARLEAELDGLKERNAELRAQVDRLKTPEGVEEVARQDLGLVKEGENLYVVMDAEVPSATVAVNPEPTLDDSAWLRVLDTVFGFEG